ncbi:hypothetical protein WG8_0032, partial [Paenibacillus sp. Aloe-11]
VTEQAVRVSVMIVLLLLMLSQGAGADMIAAGAVFGSAAGGAAGLVVMLLFWRNHRKKLRRQEELSEQASRPVGKIGQMGIQETATGYAGALERTADDVASGSRAVVSGVLESAAGA